MKKTTNNSFRNIAIQIGLIMFIAFLMLFSAVNVSAQDTVLRRYGLYVGSNYGGRDRVTLSYAVTDARTVSDVMQQLGGVMPTDSIILTDPSPMMVNHTIKEIQKSIKSDNIKRSEFFFYYSGHSDEEGLLLGDSVYKYEELKDAIDSVEADVNIAVLDSCSSGAFTRMKGGIRKSPFLSDESVNASGHAFLTSSSENEAAQESDDLGASFFTHYFVTALRGAADSTLDGTVSLNEAYSYASSETLARTEDTLAGPQHPSYDIQLAGTGDLVLTDLRSVSEQIMFEEDLRGRIFVRDSAGRLVVELKKIEGTPLVVSIGPGRYSMILDDGDRLLSADLMLAGGSKIMVMKDEFYPVPRSNNVVRGGTHIAADDGRSLDKPAADFETTVESEERSVNDTAAELDIIAEKAKKRALEAAGMSTGESGNTDGPSASQTAGVQKPQAESREYKPMKTDYGMDFGIVASAENLNGIQLGAIGADVEGKLDGIQLAGIFGSVQGNVQGAQIAGVYTTSEGDVSGVQIGGIWAAAEGDVTGGQFSGVWNSAHDIAFIQSAGVFNIAEGKVTGIQSSGVFNISEEKVVGVQAAGVFNAAKDVDGVQAAGIINIAEDVRGGQFGLLNFGGEVYGLQVGLINISEDLHGLPIGLINISENGLNDMSFWYSDNDFINFGYQLGTSTVYTFMHAGFSENWTDASSLGIGLGLELGGDLLYIDTDIYAKAYMSGMGGADENIQGIIMGNTDFYPALRLSAGMKVFDFMSVFVGVNFDCYINTVFDGDNIEIGEDAAASFIDRIEPLSFKNEYGSFDMYPTWFVGIRI